MQPNISSFVNTMFKIIIETDELSAHISQLIQFLLKKGHIRT